MLSVLAKLINLFLYMGILYVLTSCYGFFMDGLFPPGIDTLADGSSGRIYGILSESVVFLRLLGSLRPESEGWSIGLVATSVIVILLALILYIAINTVFFSILFGLLRQKLDEVNFTEKFIFLRHGEDIAENGAQSLGGQLLGSLRDFLGKQTHVRNLRSHAVLVLFLLILLGFSFAMTWLGKNDLSLWAVLLGILDQMETIPIVASFIITYFAGKGTTKVAAVVVEHLPVSIQEAVHRASDRGNAWADKQDKKRQVWAKKNDVTNSTGSEYQDRYTPHEAPVPPNPESPEHPKSNPIQKLHIDSRKAAFEYISRRVEQISQSVDIEELQKKPLFNMLLEAVHSGDEAQIEAVADRLAKGFRNLNASISKTDIGDGEPLETDSVLWLAEQIKPASYRNFFGIGLKKIDEIDKDFIK